MAKHANCRRRPANIVIGGYAWLLAAHLKLAPGLFHNLATKFVGLFWVIAAVGAVFFCLKLPS